MKFYLETPDARIPGDIVMNPARAARHAPAPVAAQQPLLPPHRAGLVLHIGARYRGVPRCRANNQLALRPHFSLKLNPLESHPLPQLLYGLLT